MDKITQKIPGCVKHAIWAVKVVKIHLFWDCAYKSQDFSQSQGNFAQSHDCDTVTLRNTEIQMLWQCNVKSGVAKECISFESLDSSL